MNLFLNIIYLIGSLALILFGANWLTDGGSGVAKRFGLSEMVIGLTIVAFGTSAPELVISTVSAIKGNAGIAVGNIVGSNIANILLIIGIVAAIRPIAIQKTVMNNEIPLVILASVALLACGNSMLLDGTPNIISRVDGVMLLLFFAIFMRYTIAQAKTSSEPATDAAPGATMPSGFWKSVGLIVIGLGALIFGGDVFVDSASAIASRFGVSDAVIGLTVVSLGTSLPELATSAVAAVKGHPGLAVGNVIGSCLFNILFILGADALIRPLPFGTIGNVDLLTMTGAALLFWICGWFVGRRTITRGEGVLMTACYIAYIIYLVVNA